MNITPLTRYPFLALVAATLFLIHFGVSGSQPYDVEAWSRVLDKYVDSRGYVDYQGLYADRKNLDRYLETLRRTGPTLTPDQFPETHDQLAYYINAYNALVFDGVLERGPEDKSVWRGLISGLNFFVRMDVTLDGETTNLRELENDIIRDRYKDPRIHAAINCASISCPRLPMVPFDGGNLDAQLDTAMTEFVNSESNVSIDTSAGKVFFNEIFDWFSEDFIEYEQSRGNTDPNLIDYVNRYRSAEDAIDRSYTIDFIEYNKGINSQ